MSDSQFNKLLADLLKTHYIDIFNYCDDDYRDRSIYQIALANKNTHDVAKLKLYVRVHYGFFSKSYILVNVGTEFRRFECNNDLYHCNTSHPLTREIKKYEDNIEYYYKQKQKEYQIINISNIQQNLQNFK